ncbi:MAG TPA: DUF4249 domain-containing protein [Hanamia sp.]
MTKIFLYYLCIVLLDNCKVPYDPTLKSSDTNSLVVEGYIDGAMPTTIKLTRSRMLTVGDTATRKYELGAKVIVEDDHQDSYPLSETGNGMYSSINTLNLNQTYQYRLHIFTSNNEEYVSDLVSFKPSPPIDTIGWNLKDNGVQIFVNTHDPSNATRYYRWEYSETWEFHSWYYSNYEYDPVKDTVLPRTDQVHICWQSANSTSILLASSAKLTNDVISEMPLVYITQHDQRLSVLYSIWVKQYTLDQNGYNYYLAMQSNTEEIGSIFDPQPNETVGNIHCVTNPSELVVGYINAGNTVEKRVYIRNSLMPPDWNLFPYCPLKALVPSNPDSLIKYFANGGLDPIDMVQGGYSAASVECVDCTLNGTNIKPSFWP